MPIDTLATEQSPPPWSIWFAILGGPFAWSLQELAGWLSESIACMPGGFPSALQLKVLEAGVTASAAVIALAALTAGYRAWRRSTEHRASSIQVRRRSEFLAAAAFLVSAAFVLAVVWGALGILVLPACEVMR